jgi:hypothetical protein
MLVLLTTCYTDASPSATITRASFRNNNNRDQYRVATNQLWAMEEFVGEMDEMWTMEKFSMKRMKCGRVVDDE